MLFTSDAFDICSSSHQPVKPKLAAPALMRRALARVMTMMPGPLATHVPERLAAAQVSALEDVSF